MQIFKCILINTTNNEVAIKQKFELQFTRSLLDGLSSLCSSAPLALPKRIQCSTSP
eukprot:m.146171 g.146171  ORF g.146171 m.146171 type:complete len:56 (+) comp38446_c0_seq1:2091-2258(+)